MLAVCSLVLFIDGFDMYFFGKILPAIADGLGVPPPARHGVVTSGLSSRHGGRSRS
jgi:AAHS family 4-hydroxybenzoate transporter-like MFS transporter